MCVSFPSAAAESDVAEGARRSCEYALQRGRGGDFRRLPALAYVDDEPATILVVEDHLPTRRFLADNLAADGWEVLEADCARDAHRLMASGYPDLAIVDLGLPDRDGLELLREVREADRIASRVDPDMPLLVLSGRCGEVDRLRGFRRGCDDYVVKPFSYSELHARIAALLRRSRRRPRAGRLRVGCLEVDPLARQAWLSGEPLSLSKKEFALLRALAADPTRVFTREELLRGVWGFRALGATRTLDSHACRLRKKLGSSAGRYIINVWGVGYRLVDGGVD
jgi:DNA-binding response OmpR family regulator